MAKIGERSIKEVVEAVKVLLPPDEFQGEYDVIKLRLDDVVREDMYKPPEAKWQSFIKFAEVLSEELGGCGDESAIFKKQIVNYIQGEQVYKL